MKSLEESGYVLERSQPLGRGGTAEVYAAYHPGWSMPLALKVFKRGLSRVALHRLEREQRLMQRFAAHPRLVGLLDAGLWKGRVALVMPLMEGGSVADHREELAGNLLAVWTIAGQVMEGLHVLHEAKVVHRDLKPQNLLMDRQGNVRIADLGIARIVDSELTRLTGPLGTLTYMPPEQLDDPRSVGTDSDLFALSMVLFELLTGEHPFPDVADMASQREDEQGRSRVNQAHYEGDRIAVLAEGGMPSMIPFFRRALSLERAQRPANVHEFAEAFFPALSELFPGAPTRDPSQVPVDNPEVPRRRITLPLHQADPGVRAPIRLWLSIRADVDVAVNPTAFGHPEGRALLVEEAEACGHALCFPIVLGREPPAHLLVRAPAVSRQHAMLFLDAAGLVVQDLGSTNGVYLEDSAGGRHRVSTPVLLEPEHTRVFSIWLGAGDMLALRVSFD